MQTHRDEIQKHQAVYNKKGNEWNKEKQELVIKCEMISRVSQDSLHQATIARTSVEAQRAKIKELANELKSILANSKVLKDKIDAMKSLYSISDTLTNELSANKTEIEKLNQELVTQKKILKAVKVSATGQKKLDEIKQQLQSLAETRAKAETDFEKAISDLQKAKENETNSRSQLAIEEREFVEAQNSAMIIEAEVRVLQKELLRIKENAVAAGRKNLTLQMSLREEKLRSTQNFMLGRMFDIYKPERTQAYLLEVQNDLYKKQPLPPLQAK